jgi:hypothetical protein
MCRSNRQPATLQIELSPEYDHHRLAVAFAAALPFIILGSAVTSLLGMA